MDQALAKAQAPKARIPERGMGRPTERTEERKETRVARLERPQPALIGNDGRFSLDESRIDPEWSMEWKRVSIFGQPDVRNQVEIRRYHWQPVPHKLQPHILGHLAKSDEDPIIVDGLQLFMRPSYLNDEAHEENRMRSKAVTQQQLAALRLQSKAQVGAERTKITRGRERAPQEID